MGTIVVGLLVIILLILAVRKIVIDKRNGKSCSCGGNCNNCGTKCRNQKAD